MHKVYIVDMEVISPLGASLEQHMRSVKCGHSGSGYITQFDASEFPTTFGCEVTDDFSSSKRDIPSNVKETFHYDRKPELFCSCTELLKPKIEKYTKKIVVENSGIFLGVGFDALSESLIKEGALFTDKMGMKEFAIKNASIPHINKVLNPAGFMAQYIASRLNVQGPRATNLSACAASSQAIGAAYRAIQSGTCTTAITGGVDSTINPFTMAAFSQLNMISTRNNTPETASRPFDLHRDGFVPGEGAALLFLASDKVVHDLGITPLARIAGYGSSLDGYKITAPHEDGLGAELAMKRALKDANWKADSIEYLNAHGTSTPLNDSIECTALSRIFGDHLKSLLVSSTKSQMGHLIAAGGGMECATVAGAISKDFLPPSINVERQDSSCPVNLVTVSENEKKVTRTLSNSFALAGQNCCLAIEAIS